ncbi:MAG TPA: peptidoglycan editing factor PgeF [Myxococcales bacterium]|nr:peptidoglycan editing factor PgeF [Myxococcales bacterium]
MDDALFITSRLLAAEGVVHGFSVRTGGVSRGPYQSLNVGRGVGDDPRAVDENLRRLAAAAGFSGADAFVSAHQVHGDRVVAATRGSTPREVLPPSAPPIADVGQDADSPIRADAVISLERGAAAAVRVADCVPVLLYAPDVGVACAVHSGWRGARAAIAARGVRALQLVAGADPARIVAAIGPCIGRCCYEVGADLASSFRNQYGPRAADDPQSAAKPHLDLRFCVESALISAGVSKDRIEHAGGCTSCDISAFFSHRRDRGTTGRHLAFIESRRAGNGSAIL